MLQRTPEAGRTPESKSVDSIGQQQQAQAQPASWSAIAAQGAAKGSGSPPAPGAGGRSHSSGLSHRGSATDLRQEQVRASFKWLGRHAEVCACQYRRAAALLQVGTLCDAGHAWCLGELCMEESSVWWLPSKGRLSWRTVGAESALGAEAPPTSRGRGRSQEQSSAYAR